MAVAARVRLKRYTVVLPLLLTRLTDEMTLPAVGVPVEPAGAVPLKVTSMRRRVAERHRHPWACRRAPPPAAPRSKTTRM